MTYEAFTASDFDALTRVRRSSAPLPQAALCALGVIASTSAGLWFLYAPQRAMAPRSEARLALVPVTLVATIPEGGAAKPRDPTPTAPSVISPAFTLGPAPTTFALSAPLSARFEIARTAGVVVASLEPQEAAQEAVVQATSQVTSVAEPQAEAVAPPMVEQQEPAIVPALPTVSELVPAVPLPAPRPAFLIPRDEPERGFGRRRLAPRAARAVAAVAAVAPETPPDRRSFFDKLFNPLPPPGTALAYAAPGDGGFGIFAAHPARGTGIAVYDIAAHTVILPDGRRLEAHSGLGGYKDDPRSAAVHMRGATPPAVYDLTPREALFHGVRALRLVPVGGIPYGRMGLLAHSYMLGPRGDSNGCVVFRDYNAFRRAYDNGLIRRLVVIARS